MTNFKLKNLAVVSFLLILFFIISLPVYAQTETLYIDIDLSTNNVALKSELEVKLLVVSHEPINAFDIVLEYPQEYFDFIRGSSANSIVSVWQSLPPKAREGNIRLTGGMIKSFLGKGEIITLIFQAKKPGDVAFVIKKTDFALADGKGTVISAPEVNQIISIEEALEQVESKFISSAPRISEIAIMQDPLEKKTIAMVKTEDDGAVEEIYVRSRKWILWGDWQKTQLLATVPKDAWAIQASVISWDGSQSDAIIYRWNVVALKVLLILLSLSAVWYLFRRVKKKIESKK